MTTRPTSPLPEEIKKRAQWRVGAWWFGACLTLLALVVDLRLLLLPPGAGHSVPAKTAVAAVLLVAAAACVLFARHNERIAKGTVAARTGEFVELTADRKRNRSTIIGAVLTAVLLAGGVVLLVMAISQHARSEQTQDHGILDSGTVTHVDDQTSCSHYTCDSSSNLSVRLDKPVEGHTTTTVHDPDEDDQLQGATHLPVFVDRDDPSYAELPGRPLVGTGLLSAALVLVGVIVAAVIVAIADSVRVRRRRRTSAAPAPN